MWWVRVMLVFLLPFSHQFQQGSSSTTTSKEQHVCAASSCGKISNISYPFRLKNDPKHCGDNRYELACENNVTSLYLYSAKYHVQSINYNNFTIRLVDPGVQKHNCSSPPINFLSQSNFCETYNFYDDNCNDPYQAITDQIRLRKRNPDPYELLFNYIVYLNCTHPVTNNHEYVNTSPYVNWHSEGYIYAMAGDLYAKDMQVGCHVKLVTLTSYEASLQRKQLSYDVIHKALVYGFEVSWLRLACNNLCGDRTLRACYFNASGDLVLQCSLPSCIAFAGYGTSGCGNANIVTANFHSDYQFVTH